jgi:hypothetical protein
MGNSSQKLARHGTRASIRVFIFKWRKPGLTGSCAYYRSTRRLKPSIKVSEIILFGEENDL